MSQFRSVVFSIPLIGIATIVMGTLSLLTSFFDASGNAMHRLARIWAKMLLAVSFIRVRTEGIEKFDPNATYVFVANHASFMDIPAILSKVDNQFRFFAKKGLFQIPFLGTHLLRAGHLPVERQNPRAAVKIMSEAARIISERGTSLLLFPEGGRSPQGLRDFKEGAAYIAIKAGVPVVPMALVGMRELLPMGSGNIRSGTVVLRVGEPIPTRGMQLSQRMELTQRLYGEISAMLAGAAQTPTASRES